MPALPAKGILFVLTFGIFLKENSIVRTCGEYAKRTNEMFSIGKHQVKHWLSFSTFLRKSASRSLNPSGFEIKESTFPYGK